MCTERATVDSTKLLRSMEILVEMPQSVWPVLRDSYKNQWPRGAVAYCLLDAQITYRSHSEAIGFKVYCPEGDIANGMIATSDESGYYQVYIHPMETINKIEEALLLTSLINWKKVTVFPSANSNVIKLLKRLPKHIICNLKPSFDCHKFIVGNESSPYKKISCPPNTYVSSLKPEHLDLVDKTWTFHSERSRNYFENLMINGLTYVLYTTNDEPLAWINVDIETGAFSHLYCVKERRRKGYAEFITKVAVNDLLEKGKVVLVYTLEDNDKAKKLFEKLGFECFGADRWKYLDNVALM